MMAKAKPAEPAVLTLTEAAAFLRLDRKTVVKLATGDVPQLPGRRIGRDWRFLRVDLERFVHGDRAA